MTEDAGPHRHRWAGIELFLRTGHPYMNQACPCGATQELRAFERYWQPEPAAPAPLDPHRPAR